jgi:inositol hexakisphosphate/diphosphoinositol-pentakisphosphate kinase
LLTVGVAFEFVGFPLDKAVSYANLRNPLLINDLNTQYYIQDRYNQNWRCIL